MNPHLMTLYVVIRFKSCDHSRLGDPKALCMGPHSVTAALVLGTHLLRSLWGFGTGDTLQSELVELRLEVFRAREILGSYNRVLENCEAEGSWLRLTNKLISGINIVLVGALILVFCWTFYIRGAPPRLVSRKALEEIVASDDEPEIQLLPTRTGPKRPSSFGTGK